MNYYHNKHSFFYSVDNLSSRSVDACAFMGPLSFKLNLFTGIGVIAHAYSPGFASGKQSGHHPKFKATTDLVSKQTNKNRELGL